MAAASATGTSHQRRGSAVAATIDIASANARKVRCVPTSGISSSAERNTPASEPIVEIA